MSKFIETLIRGGDEATIKLGILLSDIPRKELDANLYRLTPRIRIHNSILFPDKVVVNSEATGWLDLYLNNFWL